MKYISPQDFYNRTIGRGFDVDGAYGIQCVDFFNYFNNLVNEGIYINCSPSGYAKSIFENRNNNNSLKYYDEVSISNMQRGDWVIWGDCECAPKSHVAMFWEGKNSNYGIFLGQSQNGVKPTNLCPVAYKGIIGVLRPKIYVKCSQTNNSNFLGSRGWIQFGDSGLNVEKICRFMYDMFPAYAKSLNRNKENLLGNYYGENIQAWIKEFQKRTGLEQDGCVGPITLAKLKEYGFKE